MTSTSTQRNIPKKESATRDSGSTMCLMLTSVKWVLSYSFDSILFKNDLTIFFLLLMYVLVVISNFQTTINVWSFCWHIFFFTLTRLLLLLRVGSRPYLSKLIDARGCWYWNEQTDLVFIADFGLKFIVIFLRTCNRL